MKRQIRSGVFETNSSSVHSLTITDQDTFDKWKKGEYFYDWKCDRLISREDAIKEIQKYYSGKYPYGWWNNVENANEVFAECRYLTWGGYDEYTEDYKCFEGHYQMPSGEIAIAFGYTGYDR